ncbi:MAG: hypothetical protein COB71_02490 [Thiotrichales bacterium]|nr:MAG: hypothetical protein COB71_02490 [Thiotrichales bacterium]
MDATNEIKLIPSARQFVKCAVLMVCVGLVGCVSDSSDDTASADKGTASVAGVANLSWVAPSTRVDNSALPMSEIGGYKVYMGESATELTLYKDISDPYQMEFIVKDLAAGTYYFAVTAYNQYGAESDFSVIASKSI